jgi:hypothetical protein
MRKSERYEANDDYFRHVAQCQNLSDPDDKAECLAEAAEERAEALEEVRDRYEARLELCDLLGGDAYDPEIEPEDFVALIDHPYLPLVPGTQWTLEKHTPTEDEVIVITVTEETRMVLGVECTVVRDTVTSGSDFVEDTLDYFAQDEDGNVWYFGELSMEYENGELVSLDGSWEAGVDGAKPGIVMLAAPQAGETYRQEFFLGEAEDAATVLATDANAVVPFGAFVDCVQTDDFSPHSPDSEENKYYAAGIGLVLEIDLVSGDRTELVDFQSPD